MIEPLRLSFEVDCPVERAFEVDNGGIHCRLLICPIR